MPSHVRGNAIVTHNVLKDLQQSKPSVEDVMKRSLDGKFNKSNKKQSALNSNHNSPRRADENIHRKTESTIV